MWGQYPVAPPPGVYPKRPFPQPPTAPGGLCRAGRRPGDDGRLHDLPGIGGKGCYHGSPIEKALPVDFLPYDDRQEHPEGIDLKVDPQRHPALKGLPEEWPYLLGYNKAVAKPGAQVAVEYQGDPILSFYEYGKGRSFAWASDCAPHWMPPAFCEWEYIHLFWKNMIDWVVQR